MRARQQSEGSFTPIPAGLHDAILSGLVDLGLQPGGQYAPSYKVAFIWQVPGQLTNDGEPMSITKIFTSSMHKKSNLRQAIESWFGKSFPSEEAAKNFDFKALLSRQCLLNVRHENKNDKTYANVANVLPANNSNKLSVSGEPVYYSSDLPPQERIAVYNRVPEWLRKKIDEQLQPEPAPGAASSQTEREPGSDDSDIPF